WEPSRYTLFPYTTLFRSFVHHRSENGVCNRINNRFATLYLYFFQPQLGRGPFTFKPICVFLTIPEFNFIIIFDIALSIRYPPSDMIIETDNDKRASR